MPLHKDIFILPLDSWRRRQGTDFSPDQSVNQNIQTDVSASALNTEFWQFRFLARVRSSVSEGTLIFDAFRNSSILMNQNVGLEDRQPGPLARLCMPGWRLVHDEDYASLTQGQKRDEPMVPTVVVGCERLLAQYVTEWVDGGDTVEEDSRAEEKSAEIFSSTNVVRAHREQRWEWSANGQQSKPHYSTWEASREKLWENSHPAWDQNL